MTNIARIIAKQALKGALVIVLAAILLYAALSGYSTFDRMPDSLKGWDALFSGRLLFNPDYPVHWGEHLTALAKSSLVVALALGWSFVASLSLGYVLSGRPHGRLWESLAGAVTAWSGVPLFVFGLLLFYYKSEATAILPYRLDIVILGAIILGSAEGVLIDWVRYFRSVFRSLRDTTYFKVFKSRRQRVFPLLLRTLKPFLLRGLASRITVLFGAIIILERTADEQQGIGYQFITSILESAENLSFQHAYASGLLIMLVPIVIHTLMTTVLKVRQSRPSSVVELSDA